MSNGILRVWCVALFVVPWIVVSSLQAQPAVAGIEERLPVIRDLKRARALSIVEARMEYPIDVEGVVTYSERQWGFFFFQNADVGVFVTLATGETPPESGDRLRIRGVSGPGELGATISEARIEKLGKAALPDGAVRPMSLINSGGTDSLWVGVEGVVRRVVAEPDTGRNYLLIQTHEEELRGYVQGATFERLAAEFDGGVVRFFGACAARFEGNAGLVGSELMSPSIDHVTLISPAVPHGELEIVPVDRLRGVSRFDRFPRLIRLRGRITPYPDGNGVFVQDASGGVFVAVEPDGELEAGGFADVYGWWLDREGRGNVLMDSLEFIEVAPDIPVINVTVAGLSAISLDGCRVRVQAKYFRMDVKNGNTVMDLRSGDRFMTAEVIGDIVLTEPLEQDSLVELTGVKLERSSENEVVRLLVSSPEDVRVLRGPTWWTRERKFVVGGGVTALFGFAIAWVVTLRRRVIQQTREIQSRLDAEIALERKFRDLIDNANDMIFTVDQSGRFTSFNNAGLRMIGSTAEEVLGRRFGELVPPDHAGLVESMFKSETEASGVVDEIEFHASQDEKVTVELNFRLIVENGVVIGAQGIGRDVSARKMTEETLRHAKDEAERTNRLKSEFLAMMSHEIRTPMNGVMGMTDLLLETELNEDQRDLANAAKTSTNNLLRVINDILDFSKLEAGKLELMGEEFRLSDMVEETCELLAESAHRKGVRVHCHVDPRLPEKLSGDANRLRQVLVNLAGNAIKFTDEGSVEIAVRLKERSEGKCVAAFDVSDTGVGIGAKEQARLFEPFSQVDGSSKRRFEGTGLGLIISRRIVNAMGGDIRLRSQPGAGSTFSFEVHLDCADVIAESAAQRDEQTLVLLDTGSSFLVASIRDLLGGRLRIEQLDTFNEGMLGGDRRRVVLLLDQGRECPVEVGTVLKSFAGDGGVVEIVRLLPFAAFDRNTIDPDQVVLTTPLRREALLSIVVRRNEGRFNVIAPDGSPVVASPGPDGLRRHALVAEDNKVNRQLAQRHLEKLGFQVTAVENGVHAVEAVRHDHFDIVFMDWFMPEMDGIEATRIIRNDPASKDLKIVAMTANALVGDREKCLEAGMDDYLSKPLLLDRLREVILDHVQ